MSRRTIGAAVIFLVAAGAGALLYQVSVPRREQAIALRPAADELPALAVSREDAAAITRLQLQQGAGADGGGGKAVVLERLAGDWTMTAPVRAPASTEKVQALLRNLRTLHAWKVIDRTTQNYDLYGLTDAQAVHITAWTPAKQVVDLYCGKSSVLGQLARTGGSVETFALVDWGDDGYAGSLYTRDSRSWVGPGPRALADADTFKPADRAPAADRAPPGAKLRDRPASGQ